MISCFIRFLSESFHKRRIKLFPPWSLIPRHPFFYQILVHIVVLCSLICKGDNYLNEKALIKSNWWYFISFNYIIYFNKPSYVKVNDWLPGSCTLYVVRKFLRAIEIFLWILLAKSSHYLLIFFIQYKDTKRQTGLISWSHHTYEIMTYRPEKCQTVVKDSFTPFLILNLFDKLQKRFRNEFFILYLKLQYF